MVADAGPYNDLTLLLAADMARMFDRNDDAMAMYAGALDKNPNIRDASYFLAFMYYEKKDGARMLPLTSKLVEIDPSNPDNYLLQSEALKLAAQSETDAARRPRCSRIAEFRREARVAACRTSCWSRSSSAGRGSAARAAPSRTAGRPRSRTPSPWISSMPRGTCWSR
jgi:tetratricopeptide (TPR) repeat protein